MDKILFLSTSFNFSFLWVIVQFSSSLSNFLLFARVSSHLLLFVLPILLLSLSPRHILSVFLVFASVPRDYRSTISIELILILNEILLFRSSESSYNPIRPTQPVCHAFKRRTFGKWSRRCRMDAVRVGFNRSIEKLRNFLPEIARRRISGVIRQIVFPIIWIGARSEFEAPKRVLEFIARFSAPFHDIFPRDLFWFSLHRRSSNYRYKMHSKIRVVSLRAKTNHEWIRIRDF